ncbi:hypothetical protein Tco_0838772 [Tanacetum coccineum]|uniref:Uncharacterized protein n=1 Tax=Tanacetum coccineum TaxID=301880 RepID=A0ABQ5ANT0_9ASTR
MLNNCFWTVPVLFIKFVRISVSGDVCTAMKLLRILSLSHNEHTGRDIMVQHLTAKKDHLTPISSGLTIIIDAHELSRTVIRATRQGKTSQRDELLKTPSKFVKSLTFGASTLMGPFTSFHEGWDQDGPDCETLSFVHSSRVSHLSASIGNRYPNLITKFYLLAYLI